MRDLLTALNTDDEPAEAPTGSTVPPIRATDAERLMRFWRQRDEAALAELIEQHAGMVWGVCSQILRHREDVEDAFQATFLILARKAKSIRTADSAAGWLYRVAFRTALLARSRRLRMLAEPLHSEPSGEFDQLEEISRNEQCRLLLEELNSLPMQYRQPLVLCYLEGRTRSEAADELGITPQSIKGRLARGTRMLRSRLVSRGAALSTTMAALTAAMSTAQAAAPWGLVSKTAALGTGFALKLVGVRATATALKGGATVLAEKGILSMTLITAAKPAITVLGVCLAAGTLAVATAEDPRAGAGEPPVALFAALDAEAGGEDADAGGRAPVAAEDGASVELVADELTIQAPAERAASATPADAVRRTITAVIAGAEARPAIAAAPAVPGAAPPVQPADVLIAAPNGERFSSAASVPYLAVNPSFASQPFAAPPSLEPLAATFNPSPLMPPGAASDQSLRLQGEYWTLKSQALQKKAEALMAKAQAIGDSNGAKSELLEAQAEAELALAEVKLCEINSLQISEQIKRIDASRLKLGSKGVQVNMLQQSLNDGLKPSPKLDVDGDFGPLTEEAVKLFQKTHGLEENGVVDGKTAAAPGIPPQAQYSGQPQQIQTDLLFANTSQLTPAANVPDAKKYIRLVSPAPVKAQLKAAQGRLFEAKLRAPGPGAEQQMSALRSAIDALQEQLKSVELQHQAGESREARE